MRDFSSKSIMYPITLKTNFPTPGNFVFSKLQSTLSAYWNTKWNLFEFFHSIVSFLLFAIIFYPFVFLYSLVPSFFIISLSHSLPLSFPFLSNLVSFYFLFHSFFLSFFLSFSSFFTSLLLFFLPSFFGWMELSWKGSIT